MLTIHHATPAISMKTSANIHKPSTWTDHVRSSQLSSRAVETASISRDVPHLPRLLRLLRLASGRIHDVRASQTHQSISLERPRTNPSHQSGLLLRAQRQPPRALAVQRHPQLALLVLARLQPARLRGLGVRRHHRHSGSVGQLQH